MTYENIYIAICPRDMSISVHEYINNLCIIVVYIMALQRLLYKVPYLIIDYLFIFSTFNVLVDRSARSHHHNKYRIL